MFIHYCVNNHRTKEKRPIPPINRDIYATMIWFYLLLLTVHGSIV